MNITDRDGQILERVRKYWHNRWMILTGGSQPNNFDHCYQNRNLVSTEGRLYPEEILINQFRHVVVWGSFGSGKTYFLHSLARMVLASNQPLFPLWLDLSLVKSLGTEAIYQQNQLDRVNINYILQEGMGIILIDNFLRPQKKQLNEFYVYYAKNIIVINIEDQKQIQLEKLQQEIDALKVNIEFLLLERSKISTNLDQMFKLWRKLQPQMFLIDRLLNSHVWKKLEQQMKQTCKN